MVPHTRWKAWGYKSCLPLFTEPYWILRGPYWVLTGSLQGPSGSFWVLLGPSAPGTWELTPCLAGRTFIFHKAAKQQPSWHWPGNQDGDKKCVCMVLVGTSDTDEVASPSVQRVNFHVVIVENNNSRLKQNNSPWVARSVIEKLKIDGKSHEK